MSKIKDIVTGKTFKKIDKGALSGIGSLTFFDAVKIDVTIFQKNGKKWVGYPGKWDAKNNAYAKFTYKEKEYPVELAGPANFESRKELNEFVLAEYETFLNGTGSGSSTGANFDSDEIPF